MRWRSGALVEQHSSRRRELIDEIVVVDISGRLGPAAFERLEASLDCAGVSPREAPISRSTSPASMPASPMAAVDGAVRRWSGMSLVSTRIVNHSSVCSAASDPAALSAEQAEPARSVDDRPASQGRGSGDRET